MLFIYITIGLGSSPFVNGEDPNSSQSYLESCIFVILLLSLPGGIELNVRILIVWFLLIVHLIFVLIFFSKIVILVFGLYPRYHMGENDYWTNMCLVGR